MFTIACSPALIKLLELKGIQVKKTTQLPAKDPTDGMQLINEPEKYFRKKSHKTCRKKKVFFFLKYTLKQLAVNQRTFGLFSPSVKNNQLMPLLGVLGNIVVKSAQDTRLCAKARRALGALGTSRQGALGKALTQGQTLELQAIEALYKKKREKHDNLKIFIKKKEQALIYQ